MSLEVCNAYNTGVGITTMPTDTDYTGWTAFTGPYYANGRRVGDEAGGAPMSGKATGCFYETSGDIYTVYLVLIER